MNEMEQTKMTLLDLLQEINEEHNILPDYNFKYDYFNKNHCYLEFRFKKMIDRGFDREENLFLIKQLKDKVKVQLIPRNNNYIMSRRDDIYLFSEVKREIKSIDIAIKKLIRNNNYRNYIKGLVLDVLISSLLIIKRDLIYINFNETLKKKGLLYKVLIDNRGTNYDEEDDIKIIISYKCSLDKNRLAINEEELNNLLNKGLDKYYNLKEEVIDINHYINEWIYRCELLVDYYILNKEVIKNE